MRGRVRIGILFSCMLALNTFSFLGRPILLANGDCCGSASQKGDAASNNTDEPKSVVCPVYKFAQHEGYCSYYALTLTSCASTNLDSTNCNLTFQDCNGAGTGCVSTKRGKGQLRADDPGAQGYGKAQGGQKMKKRDRIDSADPSRVHVSTLRQLCLEVHYKDKDGNQVIVPAQVFLVRTIRLADGLKGEFAIGNEINNTSQCGIVNVEAATGVEIPGRPFALAVYHPDLAGHVAEVILHHQATPHGR